MPRTSIARNNRTRMINFRVSAPEFSELLAAASAKKMSLSEYCRDAIVSGANTRTPAARLKRIEAAADETLAVVRKLAAAANTSSGGTAK